MCVFASTPRTELLLFDIHVEKREKATRTVEVWDSIEAEA